MKDSGMAHIPVVVGGIIPEADEKALLEMGISRVYTPKDFELNRIMFDIVGLVEPALETAR
jgi:(2R)-ethylmalonyl-CoA mutase